MMHLIPVRRVSCLAWILLALACLVPVAQADIFVSSNSVWRYFRGTAEPSSPSSEWRTNTFDDSSWEVGSAPFYFGHTPGSGTLLSDMRSNYTCLFLRSTFVLTNASQIIGLTNRVFADDGFVLWINGMEVRRFNAPGAPGAAMYATNRANTTNFSVTFFQDNPDTNALRTGTNVLALQVLNVHVDDFDFFANPELHLALADITPPLVQSVSPNPGATVTNFSRLTVVFNEGMTNVDAGDLRVNGQPAVSLTGSNEVWTFGFLMPPSGPVSVTWAPAHGIRDRSNNPFNATNIAWSYVNVVEAPRVVSATPPFNSVVSGLTQVTVVFNRPVSGVSLTDFLVSGEPASAVSGSNTTYTFTFPPPAETNVAIAWDPNQVILDDAGVRMNEAENTWTYTIVDSVAPTIATLTPVAGAVVGSLGQVEVLFSERVSGVDAGDLLVNGLPARVAFGSGAGPYLFQFPQPGTGTVQLAWSVGHGIRDLAGAPNPFAGGSWTVTLNPSLFSGDVVINEFAAANILSQGALDFSEFNVPEDWIELHNRGANAVRLLGWSLSDDAEQPGKWTFPDVTIGAGQYLVIYASGLDRKAIGGTNRLHTNFKLNPFGSYLGLFDARLPRVAVTEFAPEYPEQRNDFSYGRVGSNQWFYFSMPTPGALNGASAISAVVPKPHVSVARGYFDKPFTLVATCDLPGSTMRFTTDGSEPTATTGTAYTGPLQITNTTVLRIAGFAPNALPSRATTHTYLFLASIFSQSNNPGPSFPNTFGTQSSFVSPSDYEMDPEILTNALYRNLVTNALLSLPAISIVIKPSDMWDPNTGLYTHTLSRGPQWEKPCSMEFFTPDGSEEDFQVDAGLQAQGNASREPLKQPKHPLKVQFKGDYGPANLKYKLFHDSPRDEFDSVNLRMDFNFSWLHWSGAQRARGQRTRDAWMKDSMRAMGGLAGHNRYVHLYINGLYWGVCDPSERPDAAFAAAYLGGEKESYDAINEAHAAVDGNTTALNQMLALTNAATLQQYDRFKQYLDVPQFIDYILLHFYVGHEDWGFRKNFYTVRRRAAGEGFKYIPWDGENILGTDVNRNDTTRVSTSDTTGTPSELHPKLSVNPQYRIDFADHVHRHFFNNGALMPSNNVARWMKRAGEVDLPIILESARWGDYRRDVHVYQDGPYELYTRNNQWLAEQNRLVGTYFPQRTAVVLAQLRARGLYPSNTAPVFNQHGGRIAPGFQLTISATNAIYYTTNGSDPRLYGSGAVSPLARAYADPLTLDQSTVVKARMLAGTEWSALTEASFVVGALTTPLRITEIMYNPPGGEAYEYLELQNTGFAPLDLGNYSFVNINFIFPFGFSLGAGQRIVLANNANTNAFNAGYPGVAVAGWFGGNLSNGGETLSILDPNGRTVLVVSYDDQDGWPTTADGGGYSLEIIDGNGDADSPSNWRASGSQNGSPGEPNSVPNAPDIVINEVAAENLAAVSHEGTYPDWVELHNRTPAPVNLSGWSLSDDGNARKFVFPNGTSIAAGGYLIVWCDSTTNVTPGLHAGFSLGRNGDHVFLYDVVGSRVDAVSFGAQVADYAIGRVGNSWALTVPTPNGANSAAALAPATSLTVNEWVARPVAGADDWIELFNTSSTAPAALRSIYVGTSNAISQILSLSFVPARGFVQLAADENPGPDHLDLKLPAEGGAIILYDTTGVELQRVTYGPQSEGVSRGRFPDGTANIIAFPGSASPGASNYVLNYTGPILNEVFARNTSAVVGPFGGFSDYLELYNSAGTAFDLGGMGLSDEADGAKFVFPAGTFIPAGGYLVVWCDSRVGVSTTGSLNTGFSLSSRSGGVYLFNAAGQAVNTIEYGSQVRDLPIGLSSGQWRLLVGATPGAANATPVALGATSNLRINEWMAEPMEGDGWLELYNADSAPVSLGGLFLSDDPSLAGLSNTPIAALSFIGSKDWVQWIADGNPASGRDHVRFQLDAAGETLRLYAPDFSVIDSVSFGVQPMGVSQGRLPDGAASVVSFPASPTPDASNYLPLSSVVISEILAHTDLPFEDAIEIQNMSASPVAIGGWWISSSQRDLRKFQVPPGTTLPAGGFKVFYEYEFNASGSGLGTNFTLNSARGDSVYLSEADAGGNLTGLRAGAEFGPSQNSVSVGRFLTSLGADFVALSSRTFGVDSPASVGAFRTGTGLSNSYPAIGPVIINEIMYHPVSGVGTNATEKASEEFIELHNVTAAPVPLFDPARPTNVWTLSGGVSFAFSSALTIPPRGYVVLVSFDPAVDTVATANFRGRYGTNGTLVGPFSGRLNNTGEELALHRPDVPQAPPHPDAGLIPMILVDRVVYDDLAPWPLAADAGGGSLQRTAMSLYGNEPLNWKAEPATAGATNTPGATLAPTISAQPVSQTAIVGNNVTLSVAAAGSTPLSYQWQRGGVDLVGATDPTLSIMNVQSGDAGVYTVIVTNSAGSVTSQGALLTVLVPPFIIEHPLAQSAVAGTTVQFVVSADGTAPLSYQWRFNGAAIGGATDPVLHLDNVQAASAGEYSVIITNTVGAVTSLVATLSIVVAPAITSDPASLTVIDGDPATFAVSATGTAPLTYQWRRDGVNIPGATSATYTIDAANSSDEGVYSVLVSNAGGSAISLGAQLFVNSGVFLSNPKVAAGGFQFTLNGQPNRSYTVEVSSNFADWTNLTNIALNTSQHTISDLITNAPARFYRVRVQP